MEQLIATDQNELLGKPVVAGTRISVEQVLVRPGAGETIDELLAAHPRLTREGVQAPLSDAARVLRSDVLHPSGGSPA